MLSRREKLLHHPWREKRYENHRRKVLTALPAVDNRTPVSRKHVAVKQKRLQQESERCSTIARDNLILLQKLCWIMRTNRVDNFWVEPQPNFLNRVSIYNNKKHRGISKSGSVEEEKTEKEEMHSRKQKCSACTPQKEAGPEIPEERVPWEPEKPPLSLKFRSKSVPSRKRSSLPTIRENISRSNKPVVSKPERTSNSAPVRSSGSFYKKPERAFSKSKRVHSHERPLSNEETRRTMKGYKDKTENKVDKFEKECVKYLNSIVLSRGSLVLAINFPSDSSVKIKSGNKEKIFVKGLCGCRNNTGICQ